MSNYPEGWSEEEIRIWHNDLNLISRIMYLFCQMSPSGKRRIGHIIKITIGGLDDNGNESIISEQAKLYYIESVVQTERGWFAIIMKYGIDGNFADVYGESEDEAYQAAIELIGDRYESEAN